MLEAVRSSGGTRVAVSDEEMLESGADLAAQEDIFPAPEGARAWPLLPLLLLILSVCLVGRSSAR